MQINIDKKTGSLLVIIVILVATLFGITVNKSDGFFGIHADDSMGMHGQSNSSSFSGADVMFLQMMIPHHQQAIDISNIALKTSKDAELLALAQRIVNAQSAEISQMKLWLKAASASTDAGHSMDGMGGMLDDTELYALASASGTKFDSLWLKGMIGHHDGAIHMTQMIQDASNPEVKKFGENVVRDQSAQIKQMKAMLKRIG